MKYKKLLFLMMFSCSSFALNLPPCNDSKVVDEVKQQNRLSVITDLIGAAKEPDKKLVDDLSKTLKGLDIKLKNISNMNLKNDSGVLVCRTEIGLFVGNELKKDAAVLYIIEKDKSDPSKFQVISNIAKFN